MQNGTVIHELNYVLPSRFYVEIESTLTASFMSCKGLGFTMKKNEYAEGGVNDQRRLYLGPVSFTDVTLVRGVTDSIKFWEWASEILDPAKANTRRNVNILVFNQAGETMQCWTLVGAVVTGFKAPDLLATLPEKGATAAIEQLIISYEGMCVQRRAGGGRALMVSRDDSGYFN